MRFFYFLLFLFSVICVKAQNCTVNADVDKTLCANATMNLSGLVAGLSGSTGTLWTKLSGPSCTIVNPASLNTNVTNFSAGTYVFQLSTTCQDGGPSSDQVTFTVKPVTLADAGRDTTYCSGNFFIMGNDLGTNETGQWFNSYYNSVQITGSTISPTTSIIVNQGSYNSSGPSYITWRITNTNGCSSQDAVLISNTGGVSPVDAGPDQTLPICYNNERSFLLNPSFGGYNTNGQHGIWKFVSGPNVPTFTTDSMRYINSGGYVYVSASQDGIVPGTYVFQWVVSGPCVNGSDFITITIPAGQPSPTWRNPALNPYQICVGSNTPLHASATPILSANEVGQWTASGPSFVNILNPNNDTTTMVNLNTLGTYYINYVVTNTITGCTSPNAPYPNQIKVVDTTRVILATLNIPTRDTILPCGVKTTIVSYTATGAQACLNISANYLSGGYYPPNTNVSGYGFCALPVSNTSFSFYQPGQYELIFNIVQTTGSACSGSGTYTITKSMKITISDSPTGSNAGSAQNLACGIFSTSLNGNQPTTGMGTWTQLSGPNTANIVNPSLRNTDINGFIAGIYKFRWTISNGYNCPATSDDVLIYVSGNPLPAANAGNDQIVCANTPIQLSGSAPTLGSVGTWSVSPSAGVMFSNINSQTPTVNGLSASTVYTFVWKIANACGSVNDAVQITTGPTTGPSVADAGANNCLTSGTATTILNAANPSFGAGTWSLSSGPNAPSITNTALRNTTVTGLISGSYYFVWTISVVGCSSTSDTMLVTISAPTSTANAGPDHNNICGTSTNLAATIPAVGIGTWTQLSGPSSATIALPTSNTSNISGLSSGYYTFRWTVSNGGCPSNFDDVNIITTTPPSLANAGTDTALCGAQYSWNYIPVRSNTLTIGTGYWSLPYNSGYWWYDGISFNNSDLNNPNSTILIYDGYADTKSYVVRWNATSGTGCPSNYDDKIIRYTKFPSLESYYPVAICSSTSNITPTATIQTGSHTSGTWSYVSGPTTPAVTTLDSIHASVSGLGIGDYVFRFTSDDCPGSIDMQLKNGAAQPASIRDTLLCGPGDPNGWGAQVMGNYSNYNASQYWEILSVTPSTLQIYYGDTTQYYLNFKIITVDTGDVVVKYTIIDKCGGISSDTAHVRLYPLPQMKINIDVDLRQLCGLPYTNVLNVVNFDTTNLYQYTGTSFHWHQLMGPGGFNYAANDSISLSDTLQNLATGYYQFSYVTERGQCSTALPWYQDQPQVIDFSVYHAGGAGNDDTLCVVNDIIILNGTSGSTDTTSSGQGWQYISGPTTPVFTDAHNPTTTVTNLTPGVYLFEWHETDNMYCGSGIVDDVEITVVGNYSSGPDQALCSALTANMAASDIVGGTGIWTQESGAPTSINDITLFKTNITGLTTGVYKYRWTWTSPGCSSFDEMIINVEETPTVSLISSASSICSGSMSILSPSGASSYTLTPGDLIGNSFSVTPTSTTTYSLIGASTTNSCISGNTEEITINVTSPCLFLPIELINFEVSCHNNSVNLRWSTASEENNRYFQIERSVDGLTWENAGVVNSKGNSSTTTNYEYNDDFYVNSIIYYRLKQVNFDKTYMYSYTQSSDECDDAKTIITLYPNPSDGIVYTKNVTNNHVQVKITDVIGRVVYLKNEIIHNEINVSYLKPGTYSISITDYNSKPLLTEKLIIIK